MRVVLFVCLLFIVGFFAVEANQKVCPYTCGCSTRNNTPVCGESGRTHQNHCLARCYKDKIVKETSCEPKTPVKRSIKRTCRNKKYGNGIGTYCCTWTQGQKKTTRKCSFVGCITLGSKSNCYWKKTPGNTKNIRRYCCPFLVKKCGKTFKRVPQGKCHYVGKSLSSVVHKNCSWKKFGALGRRKYCCKKKVTCSGKHKCVTHSNKCHFVGSIITSKRTEVCTWEAHGNCRQMRCIPVVQRCISSPAQKRCHLKTKKCTVTKKSVSKCSKRFISKGRWVGKKICSKNQRQTCHYKKFGKSGRRKRCCTYSLAKNGKRYNVKCRWVGCARKQSLKVKCSIKKVGKFYKRQCCTWRRVCRCGACSDVRKKCRYTGRSIRIHSGKKCQRVAISNNAFQTRCCSFVKKYNRHTKLYKVVKRCNYKNDSIMKKRYIKCQWKKVSKHRSRKLCVTYQKVCKRQKCGKPTVVSKKYVGYTLFVMKKKNCSMKKVGKHAKRRFCCANVKVCKGKGNCRQKRKCSFHGKVVKRIPMFKCHWRFYKNRASKRKHCCRWTNFCLGKKCVPEGKTCNWKGATIKYQVKQVCQKAKVHGGLRKRCQTVSKRCVNSTCKVTKKTKWTWVGGVVSTKYVRDCVFKSYGRFQRRKYCKRFHKKCSGDACKLRFKEAGWVGPIFTKKPMSKCFWKSLGKNKGYLPTCCTWFIRCIGKAQCSGKKTPPRDRKCKTISKKVVHVGKKTKCTWRKYAKKFRRLRCCAQITKRVKNFKPVSSCVWKGKAVLLKKVYYKTRKICTKHQCCQQLSKCTSSNGCHVVKNQRCKPYTGKHSNYCYSYGNSWVRPFKQNAYRHALAGDFNLVTSKRFTCQQRSVQWKNGLVTLYSFACSVNGDIVESVSRKANEFLINKSFHLKLSKHQVYKLPKGGYIKLYSNSRVVVDSGDGYLSAIYSKWDSKSDQDRWLSLAVKVPSTKTFTGMCSSKVESRSAKGLFKKEFHTKTARIATRSCSKSKRKQYIADCKRIGIKNNRNLLHRCVFDLTRGMPLDATRYLLKLKKFAHSHKLVLRRRVLKRANLKMKSIERKANQFLKSHRKGGRKGTRRW